MRATTVCSMAAWARALLSSNARAVSPGYIANWCWVRTYKWSGVSIDGLVHLRRWLDAMKTRPACRRGVEVPFKLQSMVNDEKAAQAFAENARRSVQR